MRLTEREIARLITAAESGEAIDVDLGGCTHVVGITGPPGSGKSTLVDALIAHLRSLERSVAVLAVDPSSELTGGAVLGDRVRMARHNTDLGVYIRSMATRGSTHGLAGATRNAVRVLEQAGYDVVIVETVGVGQVELEIVRLADTIAVLTVPGLGDAIQMSKAGIMEVGDVFVVNMADRPETPRFIRDLRQALSIGRTREEIPPICATVAVEGAGVPELWASIEARFRASDASGELARRRRAHARAELRDLLERGWLDLLDAELRSSEVMVETLAQLDERRTTPASAARAILASIHNRSGTEA